MAKLIGSKSGLISLVCFSIFIANILYGKGAIAFGFEPTLKLTDVVEFLLLVASSIFFVIFSLRREAEGEQGE